MTEHLTMDSLLDSMKYSNICSCVFYRFPAKKKINERNDQEKNYGSQYSSHIAGQCLTSGQSSCFWKDQLPV